MSSDITEVSETDYVTNETTSSGPTVSPYGTTEGSAVNLPPPIKPVGVSPYEIEVQKLLIESFGALDEKKNQLVTVREVGAVLRYLGCFPSQADIEELTYGTTGPDRQFVPLPLIMPGLTKVLLDDRFQPAPKEKLLQAFKVLDDGETGSITTPTLTDLLLNYGEPFTDKEKKEFFNAAEDKQTHTVNYKQHCDNLYASFKRE